MGRVGFTTENKGKVVDFNYPKLKLKAGEKARIIVGLEDPVMEYVHTLRKPVIANGKPVTELVTNDRTGAQTTEYKKDFVGNPICLGDESIIADKGMDPDHCPACALAKSNPDYAEPPKRRFAMHVIRYRTKAGTFNPTNPFSVEILVWSFTDMVFNKLVDAKEEWGNLLQHDLLLGPCTNEGFQKFDINVGSEAAWLKNEDWKKNVALTFKENQIPDLTIAVGRQVQAPWMKQDVEGIIEAWRQAKGAEDSEPGSQGSLTDDLNGLLGKGAATEETWATNEEAADAGIDLDALVGAPEAEDALSSLAAEAATAEPADGDDMFAGLLASTEDSAPAEEPVAEEPAPAKAAPAKAAPKAEAKASAPDNFDDLLAGVS